MGVRDILQICDGAGRVLKKEKGHTKKVGRIQSADERTNDPLVLISQKHKKTEIEKSFQRGPDVHITSLLRKTREKGP